MNMLVFVDLAHIKQTPIQCERASGVSGLVNHLIQLHRQAAIRFF